MIRVDIPVPRARAANLVFNMDHLAFSGTLPTGVHDMQRQVQRFKNVGVRGRVIGIFHGDAAFILLNDTAYNAFRHVEVGNPYREALHQLLKQGVALEICAVSMRAHHWSNSDVLQGVKVNGGAVDRIAHLVQNGYVQIQP